MAQAKPKPTRLDRAAQIGVSIPTLDTWSRCGVDVHDDEQVRRRISKMRNIPPELKPEFMPQSPSVLLADNADDPTEINIESIIHQLSNVTDKHQAQTVKLQIDGLINAYKLREAAGKYVSRSIMEEALIRIAAAVKVSILRMEADLPPMLEGMTPAAMKHAIREKVDEVMTMLADESAKVWQHEEGYADGST